MAFLVPEGWKEIGHGGQSTIYSTPAILSLPPRAARVSALQRPLDWRNIISDISIPPHEYLLNPESLYLTQTGTSFDDEKRPVYAVEFLPLASTDMSKQLSKTNPREQLALWAFQLLCGLTRLHQAGIYHNDLKPENILLGDWHKVLQDAKEMQSNKELRNPLQLRVADFGLSTHGDTAVCTYGTKIYQAPEVRVPGGLCSAEADVYAAGLILLYMYAPDLMQFMEEMEATKFDPLESRDSLIYTLLMADVYDTPSNAEGLTQLNHFTEHWVDQHVGDKAAADRNYRLKQALERYNSETPDKDTRAIRDLVANYRKVYISSDIPAYVIAMLKWNPRDRLTAGEALHESAKELEEAGVAAKAAGATTSAVRPVCPAIKSRPLFPTDSGVATPIERAVDQPGIDAATMRLWQKARGYLKQSEAKESYGVAQRIIETLFTQQDVLKPANFEVAADLLGKANWDLSDVLK